MKGSKEVENFIKAVGKPLSEFNPGSKEFAITPEQAFKAIQSLSEEKKVPILGGDVLTNDLNDKLRYADQVWGAEYHVLSWYCNRKDSETDDEFANRSYKTAMEAIQVAVKAASEIRKPCFIVLVM